MSVSGFNHTRSFTLKKVSMPGPAAKEKDWESTLEINMNEVRPPRDIEYEKTYSVEEMYFMNKFMPTFKNKVISNSYRLEYRIEYKDTACFNEPSGSIEMTILPNSDPVIDGSIIPP